VENHEGAAIEAAAGGAHVVEIRLAAKVLLGEKTHEDVVVKAEREAFARSRNGKTAT
jgi:hypothetical protein